MEVTLSVQQIIAIDGEEDRMHDGRKTIDAHVPCEPLPDQELRAFIAASLADGRLPAAVEIVDRTVRKRRHDWRGPRLFEKVTVRGAAGEPLGLFLKYRRGHADPTAPVTPVDREARVYRDVLPHAPAGPAKFYGAGRFDPDDSSVLLLEYLDGQKLKKICRQETWEHVVRWLARMHVHFLARRDEVQACVPRYDADFYWSWAHRAAETVFAVSAKAGSSMERVLSRYGNVVDLLAACPATLLHGEFYCTNIIVAGDPHHPRICAFDWETAALGCGALDLTCLLHQECGIVETGLVQAYRESWREAGGSEFILTELEAQIAAARAHELMCLLWTRMHDTEPSAARIQKYTDRALGYVAQLGTALV